MKVLITYILFLLSTETVLSKETISIIASNSLRPYIFTEEENVKGSQVKVLTKVFSNMGNRIKFTLMPNSRIFHEFKKDRYHAALNLPLKFFSEHGKLYPSIAVTFFQNCAASKKSKKIVVEKMSDLVNYRVAAFQGASKIYPELQKIKNYREVEHQGSLAHLLMQDRIDFAVSEFVVFKELYKAQGRKPSEVKCSVLVESVGRFLTFKNEKLRNRFNKYFKAYKKDF